MTRSAHTAPPDQAQRESALHSARSFLVQAPAGSGKTDLLTRRFLRLLSEVDDPAHIVAITFTKAAAAEMRNRILKELERASQTRSSEGDEFSMESLAQRAIEHSRARGWKLSQLPSQLRISTIDSFCREIALQRPLLSALGGGLDLIEQADPLYRRAARSTLMQLSRPEGSSPELQQAIEALLLWRDNNWQELETQLVAMLSHRDRWIQDFWLHDFDRSEADWDALRERLERPFARAVAEGLSRVSELLASVPGACDEAMELARFACGQLGNNRYCELAEVTELPAGPFATAQELEDARQAYLCLADLLLTKDGAFRQRVDKSNGFPADRKREKMRFDALAQTLRTIDGLEAELAKLCDLPPARYPDEDWRILRHCFTLLRYATAELQVAFAETGKVDFIEIAQIAQRVLQGEDGLPSDAALAIADEIHHLLVDEFQDTSRRQHKLIAHLVRAWPDDAKRSLFVVGDPMQSIYFFRDADAELFARVKALGLELPDAEPLPLEFIPLASNFRTAPELVTRVNEAFAAVFAVPDGSNVRFSAAQPARETAHGSGPQFDLRLDFVPQISRASSKHAGAARVKSEIAEQRQAALDAQTARMIELIRDRRERVEQARASGEKYRIAVLGRTRAALAPIAQALRDALIPFRAVDLEPLAQRPEVLDALGLARALSIGEDRAAWLGVLRAPWCGLSLDDLHTLTSADDPLVLRRPIPELLRERASLVSSEGRAAIDRLLQAYGDASALGRAVPTLSTGTWLQQVWLRLGGNSCVDAVARVNLQLLWRCLDRLPGGAPDLAGSALDAALEKLTAQADPSAESDWGVHLMTIHKSKGLEFEVVIVPELQAGCGRTRSGMLSWLERGVEEPDESATEFLIAPFQPKGSDRGNSKQWVDRAYRAREAQENRRILYVAATRAREELHLMARPAYKMEQHEPVLCEPAESLLSTAWPALEAEVRAQFETWKSSHQPAEIEAIAAGAEDVLVMPAPPKPALLRRLPEDFATPKLPRFTGRAVSAAGVEQSRLYSRHEGGVRSRALGSAVHLALEELARLRATRDWDAARARLAAIHPRIAAEARAHGMDRGTANALAQQALDVALRMSRDPVAAWILSPREEATSEQRWSGVIDGTVRNLRADRVFRGGKAPLNEEFEAWWIIDYKTAHAENVPIAEALPRLRQLFAAQLETYAEVLRKLRGAETPIRAGLYYPIMLQFDWWEL